MSIGLGRSRALGQFGKRVVVVLAALFVGSGEMLIVAPVANAITSPGRYQITLEMNECGMMYLGTVGSCIISLQTWMNWAVGQAGARGTDMIEINGVYDQETLRFVEKFQAQYAPDVTPDGHFGDGSRGALRDWFESHSRANSRHIPCNTANGWGCDSGSAEPGLDPNEAGGILKTVVCAAVGALTADAGDVACDITLE